MPPHNIEGTNMYEIPPDEEFITTTNERVAGGGIARLENVLENHPEKGVNTYRFQFRGKGFEVVAKDINSATSKISGAEHKI